MRKLLLIAIIAVSTSTMAYAGPTRGLTLASTKTAEAAAPQQIEQKPPSVADQLKALGEKVPDAQAKADYKPAAPQAAVKSTDIKAADVRPVETTPASTGAVSSKAKAEAAPRSKTASAKLARKPRPSTEASIRRELGRYGISW